MVVFGYEGKNRKLKPHFWLFPLLLLLAFMLAFMPRRSILSATEQELLLALPEAPEEFIRQYTLSESDLSLIRQHRGRPTGWALRCSSATCDFRAWRWGSKRPTKRYWLLWPRS